MTELPMGAKRQIMELLVDKELSASDLAEALAVTPTAVRQHLGPLESAGLVERRRMVLGPNRPTELYRLSEAGRRAFPKRYDLLVSEVIEALWEREGEAAVLDTVAHAARRLAARARPGINRHGGDRWRAVTGWMEQEFAWRGEVTGNGERRIVVHRCPFQDVSKGRPPVCATFFGTLLKELYADVPVVHRPTPEDLGCCAFTVEDPTQ